MRASTLEAVEMLLRADGVEPERIATVRGVLGEGGMVGTAAACRALGCSRMTVARLCTAGSVRVVRRRGRGGSLVCLPELLAAAGGVRALVR